MSDRAPAEVVDINIQQLQQIVSAAETAGETPTPGSGSNSSTAIAIPERLLLRLRTLDAEIADRQSQLQCLIDGFLAGSVIDIDTNNVDLNIKTGVATVTPLYFRKRLKQREEE